MASADTATQALQLLSWIGLVFGAAALAGFGAMCALANSAIRDRVRRLISPQINGGPHHKRLKVAYGANYPGKAARHGAPAPVVRSPKHHGDVSR